MLGFNGGLIGVRRNPTRGSASGVWLSNEQATLQRVSLWPTGGDPFFDQVSLLLPFEGVNNGIGFPDLSDRGLAVTRVGRPVLRSSTKRWGSTSVRFDGGNDYLDVAGNAALSFPGDYTVEAWVWMNTAGAGLQTVIEIGNFTNGVLIRCSGNSGDVWCNGSNLGNIADFFGSQSWHFIQMARQGSTTRVAIDGVIRLTSNVSYGTVNTTNAGARIGWPAHTSGQALTGFIDDLRVTKGVARDNEVPLLSFYTSRSSPPPADPIPVDSITYAQSGVYSGTTPASNALMTNRQFTDTGAAANTGSPGWISMDLGRNYLVGRVVVGTGTANIPGGWNRTSTETSDLQYSVDGTTWVTALNLGRFPADGIYTFTVNFTARFIRLARNGDWVAASEFYALAPGQTLPVNLTSTQAGRGLLAADFGDP
jgi:hypothetical protein